MTMIKKNVRIITNTITLGLFFFSAMTSTAATQWEKIVDFGDSGYSETSSNWETYNSPESMNGSYRYLSRLAGNGTRTGTATWQTEIPYSGTYSVRVSCRHTENRTSDADYYVTNSNNGLDHFVVNQADHRNILVITPLGEYNYEEGQIVKVVLDGTDDGASDCADATLWQLVKLKGNLNVVSPANLLLLNRPD